jgi:hypothetical protein
LSEGIVIAFLFWGILYVTVESSSLGGAVRAGLISESIGNLPYLFGEAGLGPVGLIMSLVEAEIFIRLIFKVGELNLLKAVYGVLTTYFALVGGGCLRARLEF